MLKKLLILILPIFLLFACSNKSDKKIISQPTEEEKAIIIYSEAVEALKIGDAYFAAKEFENLGINMGLENYNIKPENLEKLSHLALEDYCHQTHPYSVIKLDFQNCFTGALIG